LLSTLAGRRFRIFFGMHRFLQSVSLSERLMFDEPHRAATPGQLVALLDTRGIEVLGAATIRDTVRRNALAQLV
jgi:hypothetical protein